ncbi:MAG: outer membrane protein assembly factor BamA [Candidatus Marinimicrobia bacterium]|nr:outer membrane protein assembly factor BamA [Candidatus Neomarinimicrobiota bacterium]
MKYLIYIIYLFAFLFSQSIQDFVLKDVKVEGNVISSANTIIFTSGLRKGLTVSTAEFPRAIKRLWQLGLFDDVQIRYDDESNNEISITLIVSEAPVVGEVIFEGNRKIKDSKFIEELEIATGQRIKPNMLHEKMKKMKSLYAEKGYLKADINIELIASNKMSNLFDGKAKSITKDVIFKIKENEKIKLRNIYFEGNETYSDFRLRFLMKENKQQRWYYFWRTSFDNDKLDTDKEKIVEFYQNKGHRDFSILSDSIIYDGNSKYLDIVFFVDEGPKYKYRNFSWEGHSLYSTNILSRALGLSKGENYSEEDFSRAVYDRMQGLYMDKGYIYSRIEPEVTPVGNDSLDVHFIISENHKVYIRNIVIKGNERTHENVIRRIMRIYPGDVFNKERLLRTHREIMMLNYFGNVIPDVVPVDDNEVDIEVTVEEKSSGQANMNMGFSQAYGVTGGGGFSLPNFRGRGQHLALSFEVGAANYNTNYFGSNYTPQKRERASLSFTDPMVNDTNNLLSGSIFYSFSGRSSMYYAPLDQITKGVSIRWGRRFKWPDDYFRGSWSFTAHQRNYEAENEEQLQLYTGGLNQTVGISINQSISRDSRDHPEFPTIGSLMALSSSISGGPFGGNEDFHKHVLNLQWYTPTFWKFVLMSSVKLGGIKNLPSENNERSIIPFNERFIMGGSGMIYGNPLRGYEDNRVGPLSSNGGPFGGNALLSITTEFRVPFSENPVVYGMIFAEMGNVWIESHLQEKFNLTRIGPIDLKRSAGIGIRFFMPMIGKLGFDFGYGFDDLDGDGEAEGWKSSITIGQQF